MKRCGMIRLCMLPASLLSLAILAICSLLLLRRRKVAGMCLYYLFP